MGLSRAIRTGCRDPARIGGSEALDLVSLGEDLRSIPIERIHLGSTAGVPQYQRLVFGSQREP